MICIGKTKCTSEKGLFISLIIYSVSSFLIGTLDLCDMFGSRLYHNFFAGSNPGDRQKNRGDK